LHQQFTITTNGNLVKSSKTVDTELQKINLHQLFAETAKRQR